MDYVALALWSQVVAAILFGAAVFWLFRKYLTPAIDAAAVAKNEEIAANERRRDDAKRGVELARREVSEARLGADTIRERVEHDARREAEAIVAAAHADAERTVRNAGGELERTRIATTDKLRVELIEKALAVARAQAREQIDDRFNEALVQRFIGELEGTAG